MSLQTDWDLYNHPAFRERVTMSIYNTMLSIVGEAAGAGGGGATLDLKRHDMGVEILTGVDSSGNASNLLNQYLITVASFGTLNATESLNTDGDYGFVVSSVANDMAGGKVGD